jgi:DNA-binding response OmpR family regulator
METTKQTKILVIEDEKLISKCLKQALEKMGGYAVTCAHTGLDAIKSLTNVNYDIIITDLNLPDYKEFELVREIRELRKDIPVIIMSAHYPETSKDNILEQGIFRCIHKPFEIEDMLIGVEAALAGQTQVSEFAGYTTISNLY